MLNRVKGQLRAGMSFSYIKREDPYQQPRWFVWIPLLGAGLVIVGILFGLSMKGGSGPLIAFGEPNELAGNAHGVGTVEEILRYIEAKYVDEVDRERLVDGAINNLLAELDPHSSYVSPQQVVKHRAQLEGSTTGIGVDVLMIRDSVTVVSALPGGPAALAGLQPYDRLLSIADSVVSGAGLTASAIEAYMRELPEGPLEIQVYRPGQGLLQAISLTPKKVVVPSVAEGLLLDGDVAYLRVRQFGTNTYEEFMQQLERLHLAGARHLIIDLRGNSGGYLQEAVSMLSQLFPDDGRLLVYTQGAHNPRKEYLSTGRVFFPVEQVAIIIDQGSASASEIIAGAVQDWDRGTIVGQRSFGKGLVQELYTLQDGGALHITVSRYFTPSGRSIQRDYEDLGSYREGYLDSLEDARPNLYVTAGGREVYGSGGIAPDVVVSSSKRIESPAFAQAITTVKNFTFAELERYRDTGKVEVLLESFHDQLRQSGITLSEADWAYYRPELAEELQYSLTAKLESPEAAARARLLDDNYVRAALSAVRDPQPIAKR